MKVRTELCRGRYLKMAGVNLKFKGFRGCILRMLIYQFYPSHVLHIFILQFSNYSQNKIRNEKYLLTITF